MHSLDPRVNRLPSIEATTAQTAVENQLYPFEVFVQSKEGKPFQHEGHVRASDLELAFILAKETFTRRFLCHSLCVIQTEHIWVSPTTDQQQNVYDLLQSEYAPVFEQPLERFEVYHQLKRGKQHIHAGTMEARSLTDAKSVAYSLFGKTIAHNVWIMQTKNIRFTTTEESDLWNTLPDKKYRDAIDYKGGDLLNTFLATKHLRT
jgi:ring-1,2-phenylacetyl-CoA epoxidase subunit PaaB